MAGRHTLARSFGFAWDGLVEGAVRERNLRIHLALGVLAGAFVARAPLSGAERALLVLCIALVVAAESANAALEAVVDLASPGFDERARIAKDAAAGAVLALAAGSVLALFVVASGRAGALLRASGMAGLPGVGATVAALAAGLLPSALVRGRAAALALGAGGFAGLVLAARGADAHAGTAAAALCLAVAAGGAARRRRSP